MRRVISALSILLLTALGVTGVAVPTAAATTDLLTCLPPSTQTVQYSPALTNSPQTVTTTVRGDFDNCVSTSEPDVTSGVMTTEFNRTLSCADISGTGPITMTITWNTGETSTLTGTRTSNYVAFTVNTTITGTVTSGLFEGASFTQVANGLEPDIALCLFNLGTVSELSANSSLTIA